MRIYARFSIIVLIASILAAFTACAAGLARAYNGGGYADWYLPSEDELDKLFLNKGKVGGFFSERYWSSSEYENNVTVAWSQNFSNGDQIPFDKSLMSRMRAIRAF